MPISTTTFRQNVYKMLDKIIESGKPLKILRRGHILTITPEKKKSKFDNLKPHHTMKEDPEYYVHLDWSGEWKP